MPFGATTPIPVMTTRRRWSNLPSVSGTLRPRRRSKWPASQPIADVGHPGRIGEPGGRCLVWPPILSRFQPMLSRVSGEIQLPGAGPRPPGLTAAPVLGGKRGTNRVDCRSSSIGAMDAILEGLNLAQREAGYHHVGPLLIVARAGTGKATLITRPGALVIA